LPHDHGLLEWGAATWTMAGQLETGDLAVVAPFPSGMLAAVVDGLGHGVEAARAAEAAARVLRRFAAEPIDKLIERTHEALKDTRGAVMSMARFEGSDGTMTWVGVGNVEARLVPGPRRSEGIDRSMVLHGGIVGYRLPPLRPTSVLVSPGDVLILATDGVRGDVGLPPDLSGSPEEIALRILADGNKETDDALVLVTRYLGDPG